MAKTRFDSKSQGRTLRILYISREEIPASHGGAVHTWEVARNMAQFGHSIAVVCHHLRHQKLSETLEGVRILRCPMSVKGKKVPLLGLMRYNQIRNFRADVIMERFDTFGGLGAILSCVWGVPLLLEVNYPHLEEMVWKWREKKPWLARQRWLIRLLRSWNRWQFKRSRDNVAPLKTIVPEFAASRTHLVHWGADFEQFNPRKGRDPRCKELRRNYNLEGKFVIIFVSSFKPWHGALDLPAIIAETVRRTQRKVLFVLVGQGEVREEVEWMIVAQGLMGNCLFVGQLAHDEVSFWLALADIALAPFNASNYHPIRQFGFFWSPAKIFEYMASGLPVVTANYLPLNRIIQDGFNGRVVKAGDISSYGEVIAQLVENPEHIRRMGANSRRLAEGQFGWCHHARDVERILLNMVSEGMR